MRRPWPSLAILLVLVVTSATLRLADANPALAQTQRIGAWQADAIPPTDGFAPDWQSVVPIFVPTTSQLTTAPMGGGAVERIAIRALHWEERLYVMLEWADGTADTTTARYEDFADAVAVQFPAEAASTVPAICMGQADQAVNIWQWRADLEDPSRGETHDDSVDIYQFTDDLYFPAREAGNPVALANDHGATNLLAGGFGTLEATAAGGLEGNGTYHDGRWAVVFSRTMASTGDMQPSFENEGAIDVAFAVWDGSRGERDGIKSVSAFTQLTVSPEDPPRRAVPATGDWPAYDPSSPMILVGSAFIVIVLIALAGAWIYWRRAQRGRFI